MLLMFREYEKLFNPKEYRSSGQTLKYLSDLSNPKPASAATIHELISEALGLVLSGMGNFTAGPSKK